MTLFTTGSATSPFLLLCGMVLGAVVFASLGVLVAVPATDTPSQVIMLSNLVRLPLIYVSGVFVPLAEMPAWGRALAPLSPLSYCADLIRAGFAEPVYWSLAVDILGLLIYSILLLAAAGLILRRNRTR